MMRASPLLPRRLALLGLGLLAGGPLAAQTILTNNGGTLVVNTGGVLTVNGGLSQTGAALLRTAGTTRVAGNVTTAAGSTLDLSTGTLDVTGNVASAAVLSGSTGTLRLSGTSAQSLGLSGSTVPNLTVDKAGGTATLTQPAAIRQVLTMAGSGNLLTNGQTLTLLSDAAGTALLANTGTGQVSGSLTVQRYLDGSLNPGLGYRHLAAPVQGQTVAAFGSGGTALVVNPAYNVAATPGAVTPFPTIYRYDQARLATSPATTLSAFDKGWVSPTNLSDQAQVAFQGYTVQLPGASTLSFSGAAAQTQGSIALSRASGPTAADAGWNFIGNPYASPLDFSTITASQRTNMDAAFYTYESTSQYTGQYRSYVSGFGNPLIGSSQAFFVRVSSGQTSGSLALTNSNRVTDYARQAPVRRGTTDPRPQLHLALTGAGLTDALTLYAEAGATPEHDAEYDAVKLWNPSRLNLAAHTPLGTALSIDGRAAFVPGQVTPLTVQVPQAGSYTFAATAADNLPAGLVLTLVDRLSSTRTPLTAGTQYAVQLPAGVYASRFQLEAASTALAGTPGQLAAQVSLYPNPSSGELRVLRPTAWGAVEVELFNSVGQLVQRASLDAGAQLLDVAGLPAGVYSVRLTTALGTVTKRLVRQ